MAEGQTAAPSVPTEAESKQVFEKLFADYRANVAETPVFGNHEEYVVRIIQHFARIFAAADAGPARAQRDLQLLWDEMLACAVAVGSDPAAPANPIMRARSLDRVFHQLSVLRQRLAAANEIVDLAWIGPVHEGRVLYTEESRKGLRESYVERQIAGDNVWYGFRVDDLTDAVALFVDDTLFVQSLERELLERDGASGRHRFLSVFGADATHSETGGKKANAAGMQLAARVVAHTLERELPVQSGDEEEDGVQEGSLGAWLPLPVLWLDAHGMDMLGEVFEGPEGKTASVEVGALAEEAGIASTELSLARWEFWKTRLAALKDSGIEWRYVEKIEGIQRIMGELQEAYTSTIDKKAFKSSSKRATTAGSKDSKCCIMI